MNNSVNDNNLTLGYNQDVLDRVVKKIVDSYRYDHNGEPRLGSISGLRSWFHSMFLYNHVDRVCSLWYSPIAVACVNRVAERQNEVNRRLYDSYNFIYNTVVDAGKRWAATVGADWYPIENFPMYLGDYDLPTTAVKEKRVDGFVGITDVEKLSAVPSVLNQFCEIVETSMTEFRDYVRNNTIFMGASQTNYLCDSISKTLTAVLELLRANFDDFSKSLNESIEQHQQTAQANARMFASGN